MTLISRFWAKVERGSPDQCWLWTGCATKGYGQIGSGGVGGRMLLAHRFSWELHNGEAVPDGMFVLHTCDTPRCVNPAHLFVGSHTDNMRDMQRKGRKLSYPHETNAAAKLDRYQVWLIRAAHAVGYRKEWIAAAAGVCRRNVGRIVSGQTWRGV